MAPDPKGPPGPTRPKSSLSSTPSDSKPQQIFSPAPSQPRSSWFQLLSSPPLPPAPFLAPVPAALVEGSPSTQPHVTHMQSTDKFRPELPVYPLSNLINNDSIISNIATDENSPPTLNSADPWTRAHVRVCAHASDKCSACSISLTCCSCRALRYTPGPPPSSPGPPLQRSRSASPILFRDIGNGSPPPEADDAHLSHDDDAYARALAESDTCDNSGCPRGYNEPATWTITVQLFDEGSEEHYNRTFRACGACNRACKRSFMGHAILSRVFDNSSKKFLDNTVNVPSVTPTQATPSPPNRATTPVIISGPSPTPNTSRPVTPPVRLPGALSAPGSPRPPTPLEIFSVISYAHRVSCNHPFATCSTCSLGIICCGCNKLHTAPARLKLRCAACAHFACATCTTPYCCACRKPWFPSDSPTLVLASRFRGGARSTKSSKKGSSSSSQSSGPGSLTTAHSARNSPDPFVATALPQVTQSSTDEIDAFADNTVKLALPPQSNVDARAVAPSPSSNLPIMSSAPASVFSRPVLPVIVGGTEDIPTAVPSRAPSRAASVASALSTGDAGIAELLQPDPFAQPAEPPALSDLIGRIHRRYPLATLKVDDEDSRHFLARDNTRVEDIANETEYLLSSATSWPSILYFIRDTMKFESIRGSMAEFQVVLAGLANVWSSAADFDAREVLRDMVEAVRLMPKAEKEIDRLESTAQRYRNERQAARTQLKTTEAELS